MQGRLNSHPVTGCVDLWLTRFEVALERLEIGHDTAASYLDYVLAGEAKAWFTDYFQAPNTNQADYLTTRAAFRSAFHRVGEFIAAR